MCGAYMNVCDGVRGSRECSGTVKGGPPVSFSLDGALSEKFHTVLSSYFSAATHSWAHYLHLFILGRGCEMRCRLI